MLHKIAIYARLHVRLNIIFFYAIKSRLLPYSFTVLDIVLALNDCRSRVYCESVYMLLLLFIDSVNVSTYETNKHLVGGL